ncbi:uncharacterized protein [Montipora foliosa]|uniref:uncharacterized protein n=1 Tax=Montipora foliosa TaxID=591990 RepID=UPI0035F13E9C
MPYQSSLITFHQRTLLHRIPINLRQPWKTRKVHHSASDITFDQLVTQCQTAVFKYYDSKPEAPLYDPVMMREFCEENAPGLFDLILRSITRNDSRISPDREALQRRRTVSLIHILSYFRFVVGNLCYLRK